MSKASRLNIVWRTLAALAILISCGAALALGPVGGNQPVAVFWFAGLGSASALGGWLAWNSISSTRLRDQLNLIDTAFRCVDVAAVSYTHLTLPTSDLV